MIQTLNRGRKELRPVKFLLTLIQRKFKGACQSAQACRIGGLLRAGGLTQLSDHSVHETLTMGIQFCDDCGNILDESTNDHVKCDICGRLCKSLAVLSVALTNYHSNRGYRHCFLAGDNFQEQQFPICTSYQTQIHDSEHHIEGPRKHPKNCQRMSNMPRKGDDLV